MAQVLEKKLAPKAGVLEPDPLDEGTLDDLLDLTARKAGSAARFGLPGTSAVLTTCTFCYWTCVPDSCGGTCYCFPDCYVQVPKGSGSTEPIE